MKIGKIVLFVVPILVMLLIYLPDATAKTEETRIRELGGLEGQEVTVKGRAGVRVESLETRDFKVFTLRDDYGDQAHIRTKQDYPIMGVTYIVTATMYNPRRGSQSNESSLFLRFLPTSLPEAALHSSATGAVSDACSVWATAAG